MPDMHDTLQEADLLRNASVGLVEVRMMYEQALTASRTQCESATTGELAAVYRRNNSELESRIITMKKRIADTEQHLALLASRIEQAAEGHKAITRELKQIGKQRDRYKKCAE